MFVMKWIIHTPKLFKSYVLFNPSFFPRCPNVGVLEPKHCKHASVEE